MVNAPPDSSNGRVTLAVLGAEIQHLKEIEEQRHRQMMELLNRSIVLSEANSKRIADLERDQSACQEREAGRHDAVKTYIMEHDGRHKRERGILGALSVVGTAAASVLAWFK